MEHAVGRIGSHCMHAPVGSDQVAVDGACGEFGRWLRNVVLIGQTGERYETGDVYVGLSVFLTVEGEGERQLELVVVVVRKVVVAVVNYAVCLGIVDPAEFYGRIVDLLR